MTQFHLVKKFGQLNIGDVVLIRDIGGIVFPAKVRDVVFQGTESEEIVLDKKRNLQFVIALYLDKKSWVKECVVIESGQIFSTSNTDKKYQPKMWRVS